MRAQFDGAARLTTGRVCMCGQVGFGRSVRQTKWLRQLSWARRAEAEAVWGKQFSSEDAEFQSGRRLKGHAALSKVGPRLTSNRERCGNGATGLLRTSRIPAPRTEREATKAAHLSETEFGTRPGLSQGGSIVDTERSNRWTRRRPHRHRRRQ